MMGGFGQCYPASSGIKVPPLDIPYAAAALRAEKVDVRVIDCLGSDYALEELERELRAHAAALIFMRTSTATLAWDASVAQSLKERVGASIVFFGPHIAVAPEEVLANRGIDAIIFDEPEYVIRDVSLRGFKDTPGVWYKEGERIVRNPRREPIADLDELPFPAWDMLPYRGYNVGNLMPDGASSLFMQTSRGCPYTCNYCPYPVAQGHKYRKRSPENVLAEFDYLARGLGVRNVVIRDPEFTLDRKRIVAICEGLVAAGLGVSWRCETRADTLDVELLEIMLKAGCVGINMGIESKSDEVCRKVERFPLKADETREILRKCKELGIHTFCFFIAGLPGDNWATISDTIGWAITLDPDTAQFTVATPYPGTGLHRWAAENGFIESPGLDGVTGWEAMIRNELLSSGEILWLRNEGQRLVDLAHRRGKEGGETELQEGEPSKSFLSSLDLLGRRRKTIRRLVVYGTEGVSIPALRSAGLESFAVVDEGLQGKTLGGMAILAPEFIRVARPQAVLVADDKRVENVPYLGDGSVIFAAGREERFFVAKKIAKRIKRWVGT